jgi:drug/metabolite transporter (DMT)-like permease
MALGVVVGFPVLSAWAMEYVPASHGGVVLGILPLATAAAGVCISKERPSFGFWMTGLVGSLTVISFALHEGSGALEKADFALLGAVVSAAIGYAMGGQLSKELGGLAGDLLGVGVISAIPISASANPGTKGYIQHAGRSL